MSDLYECTLSEDHLAKAVKELNEKPSDRLGSVEALRAWILKQEHLCCRTDTKYLLRFLRTAKFSQLRAREIIENNLQLRTDQQNWWANWDPKEEGTQNCLKHGYFLPLPGYLKDGTKAIWNKMGLGTTVLGGNDVPRAKKVASVVRSFYMIHEHINRDENTQVAGTTMIIDFTDVPLAYHTLFGLQDAKEMMRYQGSTAGRYKRFLHYNEGHVIQLMLALFKPFMKKKMLNRLIFYGGNLEKLYEDIPMENLPSEYLPDDYTGPTAGGYQNIADKFFEELTTEESLKELAHSSDPKWRIDKKTTVEPEASFRKMTID